MILMDHPSHTSLSWRRQELQVLCCIQITAMMAATDLDCILQTGHGISPGYHRCVITGLVLYRKDLFQYPVYHAKTFWMLLKLRPKVYIGKHDQNILTDTPSLFAA